MRKIYGMGLCAVNKTTKYGTWNLVIWMKEVSETLDLTTSIQGSRETEIRGLDPGVRMKD